MRSPTTPKSVAQATAKISDANKTRYSPALTLRQVWWAVNFKSPIMCLSLQLADLPLAARCAGSVEPVADHGLLELVSSLDRYWLLIRIASQLLYGHFFHLNYLLVRQQRALVAGQQKHGQWRPFVVRHRKAGWGGVLCADLNPP